MSQFWLLLLHQETVVFSTGKWTALDGSAIDYGELHPEEDFFDPGGNQLFDREDYADDEEWENYTGNEGGDEHSIGPSPARC